MGIIRDFFDALDGNKQRYEEKLIKAQKTGLAICSVCKYFHPENCGGSAFCLPNRCSATAKKTFDTITGKTKYIGVVLCEDRNSDGNCKYFNIYDRYDQLNKK